MNEKLIDELVENIDHYKEIVKPFMLRCKQLLEKENKVFESDILEQFDSAIKWLIANELAKKLNLHLDDTFIFLEDKDLKEIFK